MLAVITAPDGPPPPGLEALADVARVHYATSLEHVAHAVENAEVLLLWDFRAQMLSEAWSHARRLRWIHSSAAGVDAVLFPQLIASKVVLTNSRGVYDRAIAEYVLGLMLAFAKDVWTTAEDQRRREWRHRETERLHDRRLLVIGVGGIGRAIALHGNQLMDRPDLLIREDLLTIQPRAVEAQLDVIGRSHRSPPEAPQASFAGNEPM